MGTFNFESPIFKSTEREQIISNGLTRITKVYKKVAVDRMQFGTPTGHLYRPRIGGPGTGFGRAHRASARFQSPAVDTGNLINSVEDEKLSPTAHKVFVDQNRAPYADPLEFSIDRPILSQGQATQFEQSPEMNQEVQRMMQELTKS